MLGMTVFCMVTGEKFGVRKHKTDDEPVFCAEVEDVIKGYPSAGRVYPLLNT